MCDQLLWKTADRALFYRQRERGNGSGWGKYGRRGQLRGRDEHFVYDDLAAQFVPFTRHRVVVALNIWEPLCEQCFNSHQLQEINTRGRQLCRKFGTLLSQLVVFLWIVLVFCCCCFYIWKLAFKLALYMNHGDVKAFILSSQLRQSNKSDITICSFPWQLIVHHDQ